jgi:hypothetical protein
MMMMELLSIVGLSDRMRLYHNKQEAVLCSFHSNTLLFWPSLRYDVARLNMKDLEQWWETLRRTQRKDSKPSADRKPSDKNGMPYFYNKTVY